MSDREANPTADMETLTHGRKLVVAETCGLTELALDGLATASRSTERDPRTAGRRLTGGTVCGIGAPLRRRASSGPTASTRTTWNDPCACRRVWF